MLPSRYSKMMLIKHKLFLAFLVSTGLSIAAIQALYQFSYERGGLDHIRMRDQSRLQGLASALEEWYGVHQSWNLLRRSEFCWVRVLVVSRPEIQPYMEPSSAICREPQAVSEGAAEDGYLEWPPKGNSLIGLDIFQPVFVRAILVDEKNRVVVGPQAFLPAGDYQLQPIRHLGRLVGRVGVFSTTKNVNEVLFMHQHGSPIGLVAGAVILLALVMAFFHHRFLVRPLMLAAGALRRLAQKDYAVRLPVHSDDELGQLSLDLNELAQTLGEHESSQRRWLADISHELRTPLSIVRGEIEALQDGVRPMTKAALDSLHSEVMHLAQLVDDLYQLSLSDIGALSYHKVDLDLVELLTDSMEALAPAFQAEGLRIDYEVPCQAVYLFADPDRLIQLFSNVMNNSLKYTDSPGRLRILLEEYGGEVLIRFEDSEPGVPPEMLARLFDRLYRVEASRNRGKGGAGIGLSICQNIVHAHGGKIGAGASPFGGLSIDIRLPTKGVSARANATDSDS